MITAERKPLEEIIDYVKPFIAKINQRGAEYAELAYHDDGPSYPFMRHLGYEIQQIMGESQENRWVIDQVMDKDGVEIDRENPCPFPGFSERANKEDPSVFLDQSFGNGRLITGHREHRTVSIKGHGRGRFN